MFSYTYIQYLQYLQAVTGNSLLTVLLSLHAAQAPFIQTFPSLPLYVTLALDPLLLTAVVKDFGKK